MQLKKKCNGIVGVPISYLDSHNPTQFKIIGTSIAGIANPIKIEKDYSLYLGYDQKRKRNGRTGSTFGNCPVIVQDDKNHVYYEFENIRVQATYKRIFIQNIGFKIDGAFFI